MIIDMPRLITFTNGSIEIKPPSFTDEANLEVHVVWGELQVLG